MRALRIFVAAYEERSFTLAAEREGATQSGVSQHIRNLEDRHGVLLFERARGRVIPTPAADTFYQDCLEALRASSHAFARLRHFAVGLSGDLAIGVMPTLSAAVLAPALIGFRAAHPNARIHVSEGFSAPLVERVLAGGLDLAIVPAMPDVAGVRIGAFLTTDEVLVRRRDPARNGGPIALAGLPPLRLVLPEAANVRAHRIRAAMARAGVTLAEVIELDSMMATLDLVARSDWCAVLPALMMASRAYAGTLDIAPIVPALTLDLVTVQPADRAATPLGAAFCAALLAEAARIAAASSPVVIAAADAVQPTK